MKILYDSQCFTMQNAGGLSRYFASLINLVPQYDPDIETDVAMLYSRNKYLDRKFPLQNVLGNILFGSAIKRYIRMNHNYSLGEIRKRDYTLDRKSVV